jgi:diguanylate cyclase (GGDEF)-like protein
MPATVPAAIASVMADERLARHPRYRAVNRRETRAAAIAGALTLCAVLIADALLVGEVAPGALTPNLLGVLLGLLAIPLVRGPLRRRPQVAAFAVAMIAVATALEPMARYLEVRDLMLAYISLIVVAVALFIPWGHAWHALFLALTFVLVALVVATSPAALPADPFPTDALMGVLAAIVASTAGHLILRRSRLRAFASGVALRAVHERARRQQSELARLNAELALVSRRDPLTGVGNRLRMEEDVQAIRRELEEHHRSGAIALVDVDHFKRYNDHFGHVAGDAALQRVGAVLGASLRAGDGVYRFGGEEFLLLLPGASVADAEAVVARLNEAVAELAIPHPGNDPWRILTLSAGIAPLGPGDTDNWLRAADQALYQAKHAGRNATALTDRGTIRILPRPTLRAQPA